MEDVNPGPPKRILYVESNEDGTVGGSHQALFDLVRHLDSERFEPVVLFYQDNVFASRIREEGIDVVVFETVRERERALMKRGGPFRSLYGLVGAILRRRRFIRDHRIDLVHVNNSPAVGGDDWLPAARLAGIPIVVNAMGAAEGASGWLQQWLFTKFDLVIAVSRYMEDAMVRLGVPVDRVTTVNHGVDVERIRARVGRSREEVRSELDVPEDRILAMMVGNVRRWKGQDVVVEALARIDSGIRERLYVVFAGDVGEEDLGYKQEIDELVDRANVHGCVEFIGYRDDVPDLLAASEIAIHSSVVPEPGGIVVLEAMALDNAVVAASQGGHVEYLLPDHGMVHDVSDPSDLASILTDLVENPSKRKDYARRARARVAEYTIARNVDGFQRIYRELLGESGRSTSRTSRSVVTG